jgi:hypothetical protein
MSLLLALAIGVFFGFALRARPRFLQLVEQITGLTVFLLLFLLGLAVGSDTELLAHLGSLGGQALLLSLGGIAGSLALSMILHARFLAPRRYDEE